MSDSSALQNAASLLVRPALEQSTGAQETSRPGASVAQGCCFLKHSQSFWNGAAGHAFLGSNLFLLNVAELGQPGSSAQKDTQAGAPAEAAASLQEDAGTSGNGQHCAKLAEVEAARGQEVRGAA